MRITKKGAALGYVLVTGLLLILFAAVLISTVGGATRSSLFSADKKLSYIDVKSSIEYAKAVVIARMESGASNMEQDFSIVGKTGSGGNIEFTYRESLTGKSSADQVYTEAKFNPGGTLTIESEASRLKKATENMEVHFQYKLGPAKVLTEIPVGYAQVSRYLGGDDVLNQSSTNNVMPAIFKYRLDFNFGSKTYRVLKLYFMGDILGSPDAAPVALRSYNNYTLNTNVLYFRGEIQQETANVSLNVARFPDTSYTPDNYPRNDGNGNTLFFFFDNVRIRYSNGTYSKLLHGLYTYQLSSGSSSVNMYSSNFTTNLVHRGVMAPALSPVAPATERHSPYSTTKPNPSDYKFFFTENGRNNRDLYMAMYNYATMWVPQIGNRTDEEYLPLLKAWRNGSSFPGASSFANSVAAYVVKPGDNFVQALDNYIYDLENFVLSMPWAEYDALLNEKQNSDSVYNNTTAESIKNYIKYFDLNVINSRPWIRANWISGEEAGWLDAGLLKSNYPTAANAENATKYVSMYLVPPGGSSTPQHIKFEGNVHYIARTIRLRTYLDVSNRVDYDIVVGKSTNNPTQKGYWDSSWSSSWSSWSVSWSYKPNSNIPYTAVTVNFTTAFICFENFDRLVQLHPNSKFIINPASDSPSIYIQITNDGGTTIYRSNGTTYTLAKGVYEIFGPTDLFTVDFSDETKIVALDAETSARIIGDGLGKTVTVEDGRYVR